jgi:DNA-binding GntR family transcriptional regulator
MVAIVSGKTAEPKPSAVQRVIQVIIGRIREGRYSPGQQIVVRDLCLELGLSKAPVREALHVLVGDGVVEPLPNRSARIRELSPKSILDFVSFWSVVGGLNARLAADRIQSDQERRELRRRLDEVIAAAEQRLPYSYFMAIANVHSYLAIIADNSYIRSIIDRFHFEHYYRHIAPLFPGPSWESHLAAFCAFCEAIIAGDGQKAELLFRKHLDSVEHLLRRDLPFSVSRRND